MKLAAAALLLWFALFTAPARGDGGSVVNLELQPRLGMRLPLTAELMDETGRSAPLGSFFTGKPVVLVFEYLRCRTICGVALDALAAATAAMPADRGPQYTVLAISIDPRDTPADAAAAKTKYLARYPAATAAAWHFLTGPEPAVRPIANAAGFRYRYDPSTEQYIHSAAIVIVASDGTVRGYLGDLDVMPAALAAALDVVDTGRDLGPLGRLLLLCFSRNGTSGRYTSLIEASLILFNIAGMLAAGALFLWVRRRPHP
jgi:protein SCO1/2